MNKRSIASCTIAVALLQAACSTPSPKTESENNMNQRVYGKMPSGEEITLYTLTNANRMQAGIITYGARVTSLMAPDKKGQLTDVVHGFDSL
ncbi:MAG: galactose-1-epimerase, partial [Bryobacteraceae bacterium]